MVFISVAITVIALIIALPLIIGEAPLWVGGESWSGGLQSLFVIGAVFIGIVAIIKLFQ